MNLNDNDDDDDNISIEILEELRCTHCNSMDVQWRCKSCREVFYCDAECQSKDWNDYHEEECRCETTSELEDLEDDRLGSNVYFDVETTRERRGRLYHRYENLYYIGTKRKGEKKEIKRFQKNNKKLFKSVRFVYVALGIYLNKPRIRLRDFVVTNDHLRRLKNKKFRRGPTARRGRGVRPLQIRSDVILVRATIRRAMRDGTYPFDKKYWRGWKYRGGFGSWVFF